MDSLRRIILKTYVMSDLHNDVNRFEEMLKKIQFSKQDMLYIVGDVFDRCNYDPNPVDLYFRILELEDRCSIIRGNHDQWIAQYIRRYYSLPERKRKKLEPYPYNTFQKMKERLTPADMMVLADYIMEWPLQLQLEINGKKYLLAHAMTSDPEDIQPDEYHLTGPEDMSIFEDGIEGYISILGHNVTDGRILKNKSGTVYEIDCGCGFRNGNLGCICLETEEEFYV